MRRTLPIIAILAGLLACSASAYAAGGAGHNAPTRALEAAFKVAGFERAGDPAGCFPAPNELVPEIRRKTDLKVALAASTNAVNRMGVVYVIKQRAACDRVILALRAKQGLYVLDSKLGPVQLIGGKKKESGLEVQRGRIGPTSLVTKTFPVSAPDDPVRLTVLCPKGTSPLQGGMVNSPPPGPTSQVYPHSYERLGVQRGFHVSVVSLDANSHKVTLQVVCARGLVQPTSPHKTVFVKSGETKSATARCPAKSYLVGGGFQRTNFLSSGGDYPTESRAVGQNAWRVTGRSFGAFGGELTAVAHCVGHKGPLLTEVSASTPVPAFNAATATTPACPAGQTMVSGGFSSNGSTQGLFAEGRFNSGDTWSATSYGYFGAVPNLTAYGYCLQA